MRSDAIERRAHRLVHSGLELEPLCLGFDHLLREELAYPVAAWSTHDPASGLNTSCTMSGLPKDPAREAALFRHEFSDGEPASYLSMIAQRRTTSVLSAVTGGQVDRASRFRNLLSDYGVVDELRAICWDGDTAWGSITLYRMDGTFSRADEARVAALAVIVDRARSAQLSELLVDAYRLTPRQRDVLSLLLLGRSTAELAAHLQAEHYLAHSNQGIPPSPYGGFLRS
ncbi:MAG: hypothetical protein WD638_00810 [Nitriliruptoraceae bacterium]